MGLDMYLFGEKYISKYAGNGFIDREKEDGFPVRRRVLDLGYWRKHPNLHGYIVSAFAGGKDDCQPIHLSVKRLEQLIAAVEEGNLPHTEGFFFGSSVVDDEQKRRDLETLRAALRWATTPDEKPNVHRDVFYNASW